MYSFATKYCFNHFPDKFPIYDSKVSDVLWYYQKKDGFSQNYLKKESLKDYKKFKTIINDFVDFYELNSFTLKEIDLALWIVGKENIK